jgi:hypothetical protein
MSGTVGPHLNFEMHLNYEMLYNAFRYNKTFDGKVHLMPFKEFFLVSSGIAKI